MLPKTKLVLAARLCSALLRSMAGWYVVPGSMDGVIPACIRLVSRIRAVTEPTRRATRPLSGVRLLPKCQRGLWLTTIAAFTALIGWATQNDDPLVFNRRSRGDSVLGPVFARFLPLSGPAARRFVGGVAETLEAESLTRVLIRRSRALPGLRGMPEYFSLPVLC